MTIIRMTTIKRVWIVPKERPVAKAAYSAMISVDRTTKTMTNLLIKGHLIVKRCFGFLVSQCETMQLFISDSTSENHNSSTSETNNNCADKIIPVPATDSDCTNQKRSSDAEPSTPTKKPKIWSIADHVNSQSPSSMQRQQQNQHLQQQKCNEIMNGATTSTGVGPPQPLPSPYHLTFPPWPHHMAAMFPRPPMIPMPGSGAGGLAPPQFLANLPQMMVPRPELLFRSLVPNHSMAPGLLTFSQSSALAMSNFLQPSGK